MAASSVDRIEVIQTEIYYSVTKAVCGISEEFRVRCISNRSTRVAKLMIFGGSIWDQYILAFDHKKPVEIG